MFKKLASLLLIVSLLSIKAFAGIDYNKAGVTDFTALTSTSTVNIDYGISASTGVFTSSVTVTNSITCSNIILATTTRYYSMSPTNFVAITETSDYEIQTNDRLGTGAGTIWFYGSANLPHNAIITSFKVFWYSGSATTSTAYLYRSDMANTVVEMSSATSTASGGYHSVEDTSIASATIDNSAYCYNVKVPAIGSTADLKNMGIIITYTITAPLP